MIPFLTGLASLFLLGWLGSWVLPFWGIALVAALVGFALQMHGGLSFLCGLLGAGALYFVQVTLINNANQGLLLEKMSAILKMGNTQIIWISVLIGALLGAMGMLVGKYSRDAFLGTKETRQKYRGRYR